MITKHESGKNNNKNSKTLRDGILSLGHWFSIPNLMEKDPEPIDI